MPFILDELDFFKGCDPLKLAYLSTSTKIREYAISDVMVYEEDSLQHWHQFLKKRVLT